MMSIVILNIIMMSIIMLSAVGRYYVRSGVLLSAKCPRTRSSFEVGGKQAAIYWTK